MRVLGLDVGDKRTGIAVSDELGLTARALKTVHTTELAKTLQELLTVNSVATIVVGRPRHVGGELGEQAAKIDRLVEELKLTVPASFAYEDETATTIEGGDDAEAAAVMLRGYLNEAQK